MSKRKRYDELSTWDKLVKAATGEIPFHGDFVGPGWSGGEYQSSIPSYVTPRDEFDMTAKDHDRAYYEAISTNDLQKADLQFIRDNISLNPKRLGAAAAVGGQYAKRAIGSLVNLPRSENMGLRGSSKGNKKIPHERSHRDTRPTDGSSSPMAVDEFDDEADNAGTSDDTEPAMELMQRKGRLGKSSGGETSVSRGIPTIYHPFPATVQTAHHYYTSGTFTLATGTGASAINALQFRLNSIYDVRTESPSDTEPVLPPVADGADATVNTPTMRTYWQTFYNYWTVIGSKYTFRIRSDKSNGAANDGEQMTFVYIHGAQTPPITDLSGSVGVHYIHRKAHPNLKDIIITRDRPQGNGFTIGGASIGYGVGVLANENNFFQTSKGYYNKTSVRHEVIEDELKQTWHRVSEPPPAPEKVTFITQRSPASNTSESTPMTWDMEMEFICQWKDLKKQYQYMTQESAISAISSFAGFTQ